MLRIIAGEYRSRRLETPIAGRGGKERTRPMTDRVKESICNLLRGWFQDARVLDLFAGVGTMGLEAISRGAAQALLVERDREIHAILERNIAALGCGDRAQALQADALGPLALERAPLPVDLAFLDPPYAMMLDETSRRSILAQAARIRAVMADRGFLVLRSPIDLPPDEARIPGFEGPEVHAYGREMRVLLYMPVAATP
jgi:16S rRNA (guanine966-N2)-methyltransferase